MVHWAWLLLAVVVGGFWGMLILACCVAASRADRDMETYVHNLESGRWEKA